MGNFISRYKGYILGAGSGLTWGLDSVLVGLVLATSLFVDNPLYIIAGAFICSFAHDLFAALWLSVLTTVRRDWSAVRDALFTRDALFCIIGALFGGPLAMSFYMLAINSSGPALTATVTSIYPLLGSALAVLFLKEQMSLRAWIGLFVCVLGVIYIGYTPDEATPNLYSGIGLALVAAIGWAAEAVVCAYGMKSERISPEVALLIREWASALAYGIVILPIALGGFAEEVDALSALLLSTDSLLLLAVTALVGASSFLMWYSSINIIGASRALCLNVTYSFWAVVFSIILLGQDFSLPVLIGSLLIIGGVVFSTTSQMTNK